MRISTAWLVAICSVLMAVLSGCSLAPEYSRPEMNLASEYLEPELSPEEIANLAWWDFYKDTTLQSLIRIALVENKDLQIAAARIEAARALLGFTRADQFPRLDLSGVARRVDASDSALNFAAQPRNLFGVFGDLSYELDIWGKLRNATEAQRAELLASEYGQRAVTITLISQVAANYLNILGLSQRLAISRETLRSRRNSRGIINERLKKGMIPEIDLNQAQIEEYEAAVSTASFERQLKLAEHALNILLGRPPAAVAVGLPLEKQDIDRHIPTGFPASLLERRPDLLQAEEQAKAAILRIGVAKAEQYPTFDLLGFVGLESSKFHHLLHRDAFTWGFGGEVLGPLIDWGKSASNVNLFEAESKAALSIYESAVIRAVQEVEDALAAVRTYEQEHKSRIAQVAAASNAARLSRARYDAGETSYLEVLDIERSLFDAQLGASDSLENYLVSFVRLYKALGGGWERTGSRPA